MRGRWRYLRALAATLTGSRRHGFFIPYRYAGAARPRTYETVEAQFRRAEATFAEWLATAETFYDRLATFGGPAPKPRLSQDWFPRLDAALAYALVLTTRPRHIVEIGSGHSTRFMAQAIKDAKADTQLVCIDPAPRASIGQLDVHHVPKLVQATGLAPFTALGPGDILFVDSSHVAMPGSDVDLIFSEILPRLPAGVLVHVHDVLLPDPYPQEWAWRAYNEQVVLAALIGAGVLAPLFACRYVTTRMSALWRATRLSRLPLLDGAIETSFWGRIVR